MKLHRDIFTGLKTGRTAISECSMVSPNCICNIKILLYPIRFIWIVHFEAFINLIRCNLNLVCNNIDWRLSLSRGTRACPIRSTFIVVKISMVLSKSD